MTSALSPLLRIAGPAVVAAAVFVLDLVTAQGVVYDVLYVAVVVWLAFSVRRVVWVWCAAAVCSLLTVVGYFASPLGGEPWKNVSNRGLALLAIWVTALLCRHVLRLVALQAERTSQLDGMVVDLERHRDEQQRRARAILSILEDLRLERTKLTHEVQVRKRAEEMFRLVVDSAPSAILMVDAAGTMALVNAQAEKCFGYRREELLGQPVDLLVPERLRGPHAEYRAAFFADPLTRAMGAGRDLHALRKNGDEFPVEIGLAPVHTDRGLMVLVAIVDITERKRAEQNVKESEARKAAMLETALDAVISMDQEGRIIEFNPAAERTFGFNRAEVLGQPLAEFIIPPALREAHRRGLAHFLATGSGPVLNRRIELTALHSDGTELPVELAITAFKNDGSWVFTAYIRDITERKRAETALRESEERLRQAVRAAHLGIFEHDHRTDVIHFSPQMREIGGWGLEEPLTMPALMDRVYPDDRAAIAAAIRRAHDPAGDGTYDVEHRIVLRDGSVRWIRTQARTFFEGEGAGRRPVRTVGATLDFTERKQGELRLQASLREKETLLKEVHHRVKNNLATIDGLLGLQAGKARDPAVVAVLRDCRDRVHSMALIHETLYRARDVAWIDFADYVRQLCDHLFDSYRADRGKIELALTVAEMRLDLDRAVPLGLLLNELLSNTLKHAFPGGQAGRITVELRPGPAGNALLVVSDTGVGLPVDLDVHRTRSLGLRLVDGLARQIGGTVEFQRDRGTTITITFSPTSSGGSRHDER